MVTENLSIAIIGSEAHFTQEIVSLVEEIGCKVIACIQELSEAVSIIEKEQPQLILINANIYQKTKDITLIDNLKSLGIPVLFISSFKDIDIISNDSKEAIGFVIKPADKYNLKSSIELAVSKQEMKVNTPASSDSRRELFFKKGSIYQKVDKADICFFQASGDYSIAQTFQESYTTTLRLNKLEELFQDYAFMRVHRSYFINLLKVTQVDTENFYLIINGHEIPFSRRIKSKLLSRLPIL